MKHKSAFFYTGKISPKREIKNKKFENEIVYKFQSPKVKAGKKKNKSPDAYI